MRRGDFVKRETSNRWLFALTDRMCKYPSLYQVITLSGNTARTWTKTYAELEQEQFRATQDQKSREGGTTFGSRNNEPAEAETNDSVSDETSLLLMKAYFICL